jgi:prephenate dehydrogenase
VRFAVVGNGLMGTSVLLAAERAGFERVAAVQDADLVVVAVPVGALPEVVLDVLATSARLPVTRRASLAAIRCVRGSSRARRGF